MILVLIAAAQGATKTEDPVTVGENLKKLGQSLSREAETLTKKAQASGEDFSNRFAHAMNELGQGVNRAWARFKGQIPEEKK